MGCFDKILKSPLKNDNTCDENKQKYLIEFILTHSSIDLNDLAFVFVIWRTFYDVELTFVIWCHFCYLTFILQMCWFY